MEHRCSRTCSDCPSRLVCRCLKITEEAVVEAITLLGLRTVKEIRKATGAGDGCTCCHKLLLRLIERHTQPAEVEVPQLAMVSLEVAGGVES